MSDFFRKFATTIAVWTGSATAFISALLIVIAWAVSKPLYESMDTYLLCINTVTTIVTFLMVFIIQYSSNREIKALNLKVSELIVANKDVENNLAGLEKLTDEEIKLVEKHIDEVIQNRRSGT